MAGCQPRGVAEVSVADSTVTVSSQEDRDAIREEQQRCPASGFEFTVGHCNANDAQRWYK